MHEAMDTQQLLADECDERRIDTPSLRRTAAAGVLAAVVLAFTFFAFFRTTTPPPPTKTVELHWTVTNTSQNLDGVARFALGINGRPSHEARIDAARGDRVVVRLTNGLRVPTSLHFHGMVQRGSAFSDGPSAVTQCPIAPGATYVYNFTTEEVSGAFFFFLLFCSLLFFCSMPFF
ncbi:Cupredoxin [Obelidium mucronatum]|nr:Cupredoxin [Obelidium mucronatum]